MTKYQNFQGGNKYNIDFSRYNFTTKVNFWQIELHTVAKVWSLFNC